MEDRLKRLEVVLEHRQATIDAHEKELADLRVQMAVLVTRQEQLIKKLDTFSSGINRGLWLIGGGFLSALIVWLTGGMFGDGG